MNRLTFTFIWMVQKTIFIKNNDVWLCLIHSVIVWPVGSLWTELCRTGPSVNVQAAIVQSETSARLSITVFVSAVHQTSSRSALQSSLENPTARFLTPSQRQRFLQLLQMFAGLGDHHAHGVLKQWEDKRADEVQREHFCRDDEWIQRSFCPNSQQNFENYEEKKTHFKKDKILDFSTSKFWNVRRDFRHTKCSSLRIFGQMIYCSTERFNI